MALLLQTSMNLGKVASCAAPLKAQRSCSKNDVRRTSLCVRADASRRSRAETTTTKALASPLSMASLDEAFDNPRDTLACFLQDDGTLVSEDLPPGVYHVRAALPTWEGKAFCSIDNPDECVTYCSIDGEGELVCEGLREGSYTVRSANESDVSRMVETIWMLTTMSEDE